MSLLFTPSAADRLLTVIGSSMSIGLADLYRRLGLDVRSACPGSLDVAVERCPARRRRVQPRPSLFQVLLAELAELFDRIAAPAIWSAPAIRKRSIASLGRRRFLFCF